MFAIKAKNMRILFCTKRIDHRFFYILTYANN